MYMKSLRNERLLKIVSSLKYKLKNNQKNQFLVSHRKNITTQYFNFFRIFQTLIEIFRIYKSILSILFITVKNRMQLLQYLQGYSTSYVIIFYKYRVFENMIFMEKILLR